MVVGLAVTGSLVLGLFARLLELRSPRVGAWLGVVFPFAAALALYVTFETREMGGLMALLPLTSIALVPWAWLWERASRPPRIDAEPVGSCVFVATVLALFVALLFPAF